MRLIVGISGASGAVMGYRLLQALGEVKDAEVHLIISEGAARTFASETELSLAQVEALADVVHDDTNLAASIASGSYHTDGMLIVPCSMKTVAGIASGYAETLIQRAADVCLKEGRPLVLVPREMPLSRIHLRNLLECAESGCAIVPPMLTFYSGAGSLEEQIDHVLGKALARVGINYGKFVRWQGL